ncbi:carboxypeptidase-like regulatory domain-containing protein [Tenacibaculum aquimarinum]|uniref:carboxypeptidase-like regulatory domain-containing protein n=1 Tax=Tenacibaculum aquimarinum TaxID=2910675 RepID=UPI001F0A33FC|nr:carboxypeptidase-like regulatory domain-containing protein [Tenacibaculum aquimarinum]MCH3883775.1 carboxypeptidase-like regulatory domain-containing protein [Tenacibaculum aquimarinum]
MKIKLLYSLLIISNFCLGQTVIKGIILGEQNIPLENATIIISKINDESIIGYTISNIKGAYSLSLKKTNVDSLNLKVSFIGFNSKEKNLQHFSNL